MAAVSKATTHWEGSLFEGAGTTTLVTSEVATFPVKWAARAESGKGTTNPEELLAAAHATCYSMALSNALAKDGTPPASLDTTAEVTFVPGTGITGIKLTLRADVPGLDRDGVVEKATWAKDNCPVSQALKAVPMELEVL